MPRRENGNEKGILSRPILLLAFVLAAPAFVPPMSGKPTNVEGPA